MSRRAYVIDVGEGDDEVAEVEWKQKTSKRRGTTERAEKVKKPREGSQGNSSKRLLPVMPPGNVMETFDIESTAMFQDDAAGQSRTAGKSQNDYMRDWLQRRDLHLKHIFRRQAAHPTFRCDSCSAPNAFWRCLDCFVVDVSCEKCLRKCHAKSPFHRVSKWSGDCFERRSLWEVGVKIYAGHCGSPCPAKADYVESMESQQDEDAAMIVDTSTGPETSMHGEGKSSDGQAIDDDPIEDDMWEDDDDGNNGTPGPPFGRSHPPEDATGNKYLTIVDTSGIHHLPLVRCDCNRDQAIDVQLLDCGLFPVSYENPRTVFTFAVLKDFRIANLECKTTAYQYFQKLRRLTNPTFPRTVPNRYRELRRMSRQWRNLQLRKWFGFAHDPRLPSLGSLATFCPACPQPGVNLPDDWENDPTPEVFTRSLVADGNFSADHLKQANSADDVCLTQGEMFMTEPTMYKEHLRVAVESKQKPTCNNHRAQSDSNQVHKGCDATGIAVHACARHGCFAPGSCVDFQKGEQQKNVDWSLCQACKAIHLKGIKFLILIYDIMCQYHVYLYDRIKKSPYLSLDERLRLCWAIGLFHVHGHREECLYRYATSFIPGAGVVDGEILETLWAIINLISRSTRSATLAHRTEILDDHMNDSNFKKLINMTNTIVTKYKRAVKGHGESKQYFEDLAASVATDRRAAWEAAAAKAEGTRFTDVNATARQREKARSAMDFMKSSVVKAKSFKAVHVQLLEKEFSKGALSGETDWIADGIAIQELQLSLRRLVNTTGRHAREEDKLDIARKRQQLVTRITKFDTQAVAILGGLLGTVGNEGGSNDIEPDELVAEDDDELSEWNTSDIPDRTLPEQTVIFLPSTLRSINAHVTIQSTTLLKELELRRAQADEALEAVREFVGQISFQYSNGVRHASTKSQKLRSTAPVRELRSQQAHHRSLYNLARKAIFNLTEDESICSRYPALLSEDCRASTLIVDPNAPGQSDHRLSWIWRVDHATTEKVDSKYLDEFHRIHWLRARARYHRWKEELNICKHEMEWTTRYYMFQAKQWRAWRDTDVAKQTSGLQEYAAEKVKMWNVLGQAAEDVFNAADPQRANIWQEDNTFWVPVNFDEHRDFFEDFDLAFSSCSNVCTLEYWQHTLMS